VAGIVRSLDLVPSVNLEPECRHLSLFQPVHGSAPDIVGEDIAHQIGDSRSLQLRLDFLGKAAAGDLLMRTVERVLAAGQMLSPDLGGRATPPGLSEAVAVAIRRLT
jgi:tartrate dehydrogenase/decarboxylase / D-malate dehydrogenase